MSIYDVKDTTPKIEAIVSGDPVFQDSDTTYNEAGVTFNEAGLSYGGYDRQQDSSPHIEYAILKKPLMAQVYADSAHVAYVLDEKPKMDIVYAPSFIAGQYTGQPMGLLLALTYA